MSITIDGVKFDINSYDTLNDVLDRVAMDRQTLPKYLIVEPPDYVLKPNTGINVINLQNVLKDKTINDLPTFYFDRVQTLWKDADLSIEDVLILWYKSHKEMSNIPIPQFKTKRISFRVIQDIKEGEASFDMGSNNEYKKLISRVAIQTSIKSEFDSVKDSSPQLSEFNIVTINYKTIVELEDNDNLLDIFDKIVVSKNVPFVSLNYENNKYYKIYDQISIPQTWVDQEVSRVSPGNPEQPGLMCKVFQLPENKPIKNVNESYTTIVWNGSNDIIMEFNLQHGMTYDIIQDRFFNSLKNLKYKIISNIKNGIVGRLNVLDIVINKAIILDMISTDPTISYFLYVDENTKNDLITAFQKKQSLYVKYLPKSNNRINSLSLTMTPKLEKNMAGGRAAYGADFSQRSHINMLSIKLRAPSDKNINEVLNVLPRLFGLYMIKKDSIIKFYSSIIPDFIKIVELEVSKIENPKIKKTGKLSDVLYEYNKELFSKGVAGGRGYTTACQGKMQPALLSDQDAEKVDLPNYKMHYPDNGNEKSKQWAWYQCPSPEYIYPGLKINNIGGANHEKYPYIPCCFKTQQIQPPKGKYKQWKHSLLQQTFPPEVEQKQQRVLELPRGGEKHVLKADKIPEAGRMAYLPKNIDLLINISNMKKYNINRMGVPASPNSILYCLELTKNNVRPLTKVSAVGSTSFRHILDEDQIIEVRKRLLGNISPIISKQEMYDMSNDEIIEYINNVDEYLDPLKVVHILEQYYDLNIFMFKVSNENPDGDIILPRYSDAYLQRKLEDRRAVFIVIQKTEFKNYQSEILIKTNKTDANDSYIFKDTRLNKMVTQLINKYNNIYVLGQDVISKYVSPATFGSSESELYLNAKSQYIDTHGKTRAILYEELLLIVPPLPPLKIINEPIEKIYRRCKIEVAKAFFKKYNLEIVQQHINDQGLVGVLVRSLNVGDYVMIVSHSQKSDKTFHGKITAILPENKYRVELSQGRDEKLKDVSKDMLYTPEFYYIYVPIEPVKPLLKEALQVPRTPVGYKDPLILDTDIVLKTMRKQRKIANFLMQYTLYEYSKNPKSFGDNDFIIDPTHEYNIETLSSIFKDNSVIYNSDHRIIVPDEEVKKRLIYFLNTIIKNRPFAIEKYITKKSIEGYYQTISDFASNPNQIIFLNNKSITDWINSLVHKEYKNNKIQNSINRNTIEPYFYSNNNIYNGSPVIIQNVKDHDLQRAITVSNLWNKNHINAGFNAEIQLPEGSSSEIGKTSVIEYGNAQYAAVLNLQHKF